MADKEKLVLVVIKQGTFLVDGVLVHEGQQAKVPESWLKAYKRRIELVKK